MHLFCKKIIYEESPSHVSANAKSPVPFPERGSRPTRLVYPFGRTSSAAKNEKTIAAEMPALV